MPSPPSSVPQPHLSVETGEGGTREGQGDNKLANKVSNATMRGDGTHRCHNAMKLVIRGLLVCAGILVDPGVFNLLTNCILKAEL